MTSKTDKFRVYSDKFRVYSDKFRVIKQTNLGSIQTLDIECLFMYN